MTESERVLASRLMDHAAEIIHERSCTEVDTEAFDDIESEDIEAMVRGFNEWMKQTCAGDDWEDKALPFIDEDEWLSYFANLVATEGDEASRRCDELTERSVGAMAIAEGDDGWEKVTIDCPMLAAVAKLKRERDTFSMMLYGGKIV